MIDLVINYIKNSKIKRGKAFLIRRLSKIFISLRSYPFHKIGYRNNLLLNLSDNDAIFLFLNDGFIPHESGLLSVFKHFESSKKNFWDIGTNYGFYPWIFLNENLYDCIYCFEPNLKVFDLLKKSFPITQNKVSLNNFGLGEVKDKLYFNYNPLESDLGSFKNNTSTHASIKTMIDIDTIDNFREKVGKPDVIKLDVEGYEEYVIKGYKNLNIDYPIISLEWIQTFQENSFGDLLNYFDGSWHYFHVGYNGLLYKDKNNFCGSDVLFISEKNDSYEKVHSILA